jgi:TDG/mug DNA glycosylase family protein
MERRATPAYDRGTMARPSPPYVRGLPAIVGPSPRILILGSMPGVRSLAAAQYYAHPRNAFWEIMDVLGLAPRDLPYPNRVRCLQDVGIALWDSISGCRRSGSLDSDIDPRTEETNDIVSVLTDQPSIRAIFFNGEKAERAFRRVHGAQPSGRVTRRLVQLRLPSTSPANTAPFAVKLAAWKGILPFLRSPE